MASNSKSHWEHVFSTKSDQQLSWMQTDHRTSLMLISKYAPSGERVIDVGGGSSTLAGRLLEEGYSVAVLDFSGAALSRAAQAIGKRSGEIRWIEADITQVGSLGQFDVWHDRAVYHFLTSPQERAAYRALLEKTIPAGGHAIIATFAPEGSTQCSGLEVRRYDPAALAIEVGVNFELVESMLEEHFTPWGARQPFQYSVFRRKNSNS